MNSSVRAAAVAVSIQAMVGMLSGCSGPPDAHTLVAKSKAYREHGNYKAAAIELKNALQGSPNDGEARYLLGTTYMGLGDYASAETELRRARELHYDEALVAPALAKSLLLQGEFDKVVDQFVPDAATNAEARASLMSTRGLALVALKRTADGVALLRAALEVRPDFPDALLGLAQVASGENRPQEARQLVDRATARSPANVDAWLMKGDLARLSGERAEARVAYARAMQLAPQNLGGHVGAALVEIAGGNFKSARTHLAEARKLAPGNLSVLYTQSLADFREKKLDAARTGVQAILKVAPGHVPTLLLAGAVELSLGAFGQARAYLTQVVQNAPQNTYARELLVTALLKAGNTQEALEAVEAGLRRTPDDPALMALAGQVHLQRREFAQAEDYLQKATKRDPKNGRARMGLGLTRIALGHNDQAMSDLESAVQLDPADTQAGTFLIVSLIRRQEYDEALKAMQAFEQKQPDNPLTYQLKGIIYVGKKDVASARKALEHALSLQPTYVPAATTLAELDLHDHDPHAARARLESILAKDGNNVQALLALVQLGSRLGASPSEEAAWLERAAKAAPTLIEPRLALARLYAAQGKGDKSLEAAEQAQTISPDDARVLRVLGAAQLGAGQKEQALATYGKLAAMQPNSPRDLLRLATAQAANADPASATGTLRKALALQPQFPEAQMALLRLDVGAGHYDDALKLAHEAQQQTPKSALGYVMEGDVLMARRAYGEAAHAYETAYGLNKRGDIAVRVHQASVAAGRAREADALLAQRIKESPEDFALRTYAADYALRTGRFEEAMQNYEWLARKQPDNAVFLNNLAWIYLQLKDGRAVETAERAHTLKPDDAGISDTLAWVLVQRGDLARATALLRDAATRAPGIPSIRYHLAYAWYKAGETSKARAELEALLAHADSFPERQEASSLLKQLKG